MGAQRYRSLTILAMPIASAIPIANKLGDADRLSDPDRYNHGDADRPGSGARGQDPSIHIRSLFGSSTRRPPPSGPRARSKAHVAKAVMATLDVALLSDEMLRLVVAFVPEERKAWMKTKRCWYVRLLRLKEINLILNILIVLNKPGISQGFFSQLAARFNALRHRFAQEVG